MFDYKPQLVKELQKAGLPVFYESFLNDKTQYPCITYTEINNVDTLVGDTLSYSDVTFMIKVWASDIKTLSEKAIEIDKIMKPLGFGRLSSLEVFNNALFQKVIKYKGTAKELLNN